MFLEKIEQANDIKKLVEADYGILAEEIREFLIQSISETGGHLGSNLGAVELTMALHLFLNLPEDKIIWDVGHQSYTHKILTGRRDGFANLRKFGGMSGFPKRKESDCDCFDTGHSSTSISAGLGMVKARDIKGEKNTIVSVIGDGSLTGGMAYEALNNASRLETNFIVVLNDNNMSISENVGVIPRTFVFCTINNIMAVLLKTASVRVSSIQIMQVRVQNKGKSVWKSRYDGDVSVTNPNLDLCQPNKHLRRHL